MRRLWEIVLSLFGVGVGKAEQATMGPGLDRAHDLMREQLRDVTMALAEVITSKKDVEIQIKELEPQVARMQGAAMKAMEAGDEAKARRILARKQTVQQRLQALDASAARIEERERELIDQQAEMKQMVDRAAIEIDTMKAEHGAARAEVKLRELETGLSRTAQAITGRIDRARDDTRRLQARADALAQVSASGAVDGVFGDDALDREIAELETSSSVDDELAAMRAELGKGAPQPQLEAAEREAAK